MDVVRRQAKLQLRCIFSIQSHSRFLIQMSVMKSLYNWFDKLYTSVDNQLLSKDALVEWLTRIPAIKHFVYRREGYPL